MNPSYNVELKKEINIIKYNEKQIATLDGLLMI